MIDLWPKGHFQGRIFEFTLVNSELTRVDTIPFTTSNVTKFYFRRFCLQTASVKWKSKNLSTYEAFPLMKPISR